MSLLIDISKIDGILLKGHEKKIDIVVGTFELDSYEFAELDFRGRYTIHFSDRDSGGVSHTGFSAKLLDGRNICGPISAITAVLVSDAKQNS